MIYLQLFWSFFQIGLFSFGGGYAALPLIKSQIVELHGWLTLQQFTDLITISQMTPGPIAINAATFVGTQVGGVGGAVLATFGCVLPSFLIMSLLAYLYSKYKTLVAIQGALAGLRPAVVALIASAGLSILLLTLWGPAGFSLRLSSVDPVALALFAMGLLLIRKTKLNQIVILLLCGAVGGVCYMLL